MEAPNTTPAPRTQLHLEVSFKKNYARQPLTGLLKNISLTGAFLECENNRFMPNEKLHFTLEVAGRVRKIAAEVIWASPRGCGVRFNPTSNRDVQLVDDLIYFVETDRSDRRDVLNNIFKKAV